MGMPVIQPSNTTRTQAITDMIQSVALEETALSHILNAEGEKIQKMVAMEDVTPEVLLATNKSVESMVKPVLRSSAAPSGKRLLPKWPCENPPK